MSGSKLNRDRKGSYENVRAHLPTVSEQRQIGPSLSQLEQLWCILSLFYEDLTGRGIDVRIASELRNCKTLLSFIHQHVCPTCDKKMVDDKLLDLQNSLGRIKGVLVSAGLGVGKSYVEDWMSKIDQAERGELEYRMTYAVSRFVPGLSREPEKGWIRLTLPKPVSEEKIRDLSEQFGVVTELEDEFHVVIKGEKASVKRAAQRLARIFKETTEVAQL